MASKSVKGFILNWCCFYSVILVSLLLRWNKEIFRANNEEIDKNTLENQKLQNWIFYGQVPTVVFYIISILGGGLRNIISSYNSYNKKNMIIALISVFLYGVLIFVVL